MKIQAQYQIPEVKSHIYMYIVCQTQIESRVGIKPTIHRLHYVCLRWKEARSSIASTLSPILPMISQKCIHPTFNLNADAFIFETYKVIEEVQTYHISYYVSMIL